MSEFYAEWESTAILWIISVTLCLLVIQTLYLVIYRYEVLFYYIYINVIIIVPVM